MSLAKHRSISVLILATGVVVLLSWGRSMANDSDSVKAERDRLRGEWVAISIQSAPNCRLGGPAASGCRIGFDGKSVVFRGMIEGSDGRGTFFLDPAVNPARIDLKLDAGWVVGVYEIDEGLLTLCLNPIAMPERLGVPTRRRPDQLDPGRDRYQYVFRKATP